MIVHGKDLKRLLRGGVVTLTCEKDRGLHAGRSYAVQRSGGKAQIARMDCLECFSDEFGWHYKVRLSKEVPPRLLAQRSELGYTTDRHRALRDEPEAVPEEWLREHQRASAVWWARDRSQEVTDRLEACRTLEERIVAMRSLARTRRGLRSEFKLVDQLHGRGDVVGLERQLRKLEAKLRDEAA